jgi:Predicted hydrolases or acyltransferases (alpha/beta hydrolase superfamily)
MNRVRSDDAQISYTLLGSGPDVVLLHPFPAHHGIWLPVAEQLATRYRCILPDLRGHGASEPGEGAATMEKHAAAVRRVCDDAGASRAVFVGVSIGGYVLFEFWRRFGERVAALVLADTRAQADSDDPAGRASPPSSRCRSTGPTAFSTRKSSACSARVLGATARTFPWPPGP